MSNAIPIGFEHMLGIATLNPTYAKLIYPLKNITPEKLPLRDSDPRGRTR